MCTVAARSHRCSNGRTGFNNATCIRMVPGHHSESEATLVSVDGRTGRHVRVVGGALGRHGEAMWADQKCRSKARNRSRGKTAPISVGGAELCCCRDDHEKDALRSLWESS